MTESTHRRLLALDGGGVKGLTSLFILRRIMHRIKTEQNLEYLPRPCEYFDLIGGTSTGGLGMGVEECITTYQNLAKVVFGKKKRGGIFRKILSTFQGDSEWYDSSVLEGVIKEIIRSKCGDGGAPLLGSTQPGCKTFVCAIRQRSSKCELLRSYPDADIEDYKCELWEAARATSAAPMFFKPIEFRGSKAVFVDGAMRVNNPTRELVIEARRIWKEEPIDCIISIGTGWTRSEDVGNRVDKVLRAAVKISTDAQHAAADFVREGPGKLLLSEKRYFRFNVEQGIQEIEMDHSEDKALERMRANTTAYLNRDDITAEVQVCAKRLIDPRSEFDQKDRTQLLQSDSSPDTDAIIEEILRIFSPVDFTDHLGQMESDQCPETGRWILSDPNLQSLSLNASNSPTTIWVYGNPGCGKTFLMYNILQNLTKKVNPKPNSALLYFFCDRKNGDPTRQNPDSILRTLVVQALLHLLEIDKILVRRTLNSYKNHETEENDIPLWLLDQTLKRLLGSKYLSPTYVLLDALDECSDWGTLLRYLNPNRLPNNKFIFSSRNMDVLRELVIGDGEDESKKAIEVTSDRTHEDIKTFVHQQVAISNVKDLGGKDQAIERLVQGSRGLFLLAKFRFELLNKPGPRLGTDFDSAINQLPVDLNDFYASELNRIKTMENSNIHRNLARKLFLWILYAERALSFEEIAEALSTEKGDKCPREPKAITRKWIDDISGGLVVFREISDTVELAHTTIKDFVLKFSWSDSVPPSTLNDSQAAHVEIVSTLIIYLSYDCFRDPGEGNDTSQPKRFALLEYATQMWPTHLQHTRPHPESQELFDLLDTFLQSDQCFRWWIQINESWQYSISDLISNLQSRFGRWTRSHSQVNTFQPKGLVTLDNIFIKLSERNASMVEKNFGKEHISTLASMASLAMTFSNQGRWSEAEELEVQVLETRKRVLGEEHPDTLASMANLALAFESQGQWSKAEDLGAQVLETSKKVQGEEHPSTLTSMSNLAATYWNQGRWSEAEELGVQVLDMIKRVLGEEHPDTLMSMANLAMTFSNQGRWSEAEELQVQVLETSKRVLGEEHPSTLMSMSNLALNFWNQARWSEAEELQVQVLESRKRILGEEHPETLKSMANLAGTFSSQGRWPETEELQVQVLETSKRVLGEEHPSTLKNMANLAVTFGSQGRWSEAEELGVQVLDMRKRVLGEEHPDTLINMNNLAWTFSNQGRWSEAEELEVQVLETSKRVLGKEHLNTLTSMNNLAGTFSNQGQWSKAQELQVQVLETSKRVLGEEHPHTLTIMANLAGTFKSQGRLPEAEELEVQALETSKRVLGEEHPNTLKIMANLAVTFGNQGRWSEAEELGVQVLETKKRVLGEEHPDTLASMHNLAYIYNSKDRKVEAIELIKHVVSLHTRVLGREHPHTQSSVKYLDAWEIEHRIDSRDVGDTEDE